MNLGTAVNGLCEGGAFCRLIGGDVMGRGFMANMDTF